MIFLAKILSIIGTFFMFFSEEKVEATSENIEQRVQYKEPRLREGSASSIYNVDFEGFEFPLLSSYENPNSASLLTEILIHDSDIENSTKMSSAYINEITDKIFQLRTPNEFQRVFDIVDMEKQMLASGDLLRTADGAYQLYLDHGKVISYLTDQKCFQIAELLEINQLSEAYRVKSDIELTEYGKELQEKYIATLNVRTNELTIDFIEEIKDDVVQISDENGMYPSVLIAQAIVESASGTSQLSEAPYFNLFGMIEEDSGYHQKVRVTENIETQNLYKQYESFSESIRDFACMLAYELSKGKIFYNPEQHTELKNYVASTKEISEVYLSDPSYANKLNSVIAAYHLTQYDTKKKKEEQENRIEICIQNDADIPEEYENLLIYPLYNAVDYNISGSYPAGQCTWYVYNRMRQIGKQIDEYMGNGAEWGMNGTSLGYKVSNIPKIGSAMSFAEGFAGADVTYGHVAFVEAIGVNGILISEGNVIDSNTISYRVVPNEVAYSTSVSYIEGK